MEDAVYLLLFGACSWQDWRRHRISRWLLAVLVAGGAVTAVRQRGFTPLLLADLLPGLFLFLVVFAARGAVGAGDAWAVIAAGLFLGVSRAVAELLLGLTLAAVWGGWKIVRNNMSRKSRLPFLPFLWAAAGVLLLLP